MPDEGGGGVGDFGDVDTVDGATAEFEAEAFGLVVVGALAEAEEEALAAGAFKGAAAAAEEDECAAVPPEGVDDGAVAVGVGFAEALPVLAEA